MGNKTLILFFLLLQITNLRAQQEYLRVDVQVASFSMSDLKDILKSSVPDLNVDVRTVSTFPPYAGYGLTYLSVGSHGYGFGFTAEFFSSGGRNYYEDYSGYYKADMLVHCINLGTLFSIKNQLREKQSMNFEVFQGLKMSSLVFEELLYVSEPLYEQETRFKSFSWWIKAVIRYEYKFHEHFTAGALIGAEYNIPGKLELNDQPNMFLIRDNGDFAKINWSGIRAGLSFSMDLSLISRKEKQRTMEIK